MTTAEKKAYLLMFRVATLEAQDARARLDTFRTRHSGLKGSGLNDLPRGQTLHDMSDDFARLDELETRLSASIQTYERMQTKVASVIDAVENPTHRRLLQLHYIDFLRFEEIAVVMGYSYRQVIRAHRRAIEQLDI